MNLRSTLAILLCIIAFTCSAAAKTDKDTLTMLSSHPIWIKLLHLEPTTGIGSSRKSTISSPDFFISDANNQDALVELQATLSALLDTKLVDEDNNVQCKFPARTIWLRRQLPNILKHMPKVSCSKFEKWSKAGKTHSLSIVYASGFLGNPASFYGHTLLKLNSSDNKDTTPLVDISVNYGALVPDNENPLVYIFKGIFGGYDGAFSHIEYFYHNHNYGETELRDLWEYELELTKEQVDFILAHTWEVLGKSYTYYFFRENCGFRMAELFELIEDIDITPENPVWTMPQSIIQKLAEVKVDDKPLVRSVVRSPSRQSRFYEAYESLNSNEKKLVEFIIVNNGRIGTSKFAQQPNQSKHRVLDTLLHYYQFLRTKHKDTQIEIESAYRRVLAKRFSLPQGKAVFQEQTVNPPHQGRFPSLTRVSILNSSEAGRTMELTLRPAYYDELDAEETHITNASLKMGQLKFMHRDNKTSLRQLDLIDLNSLNTKATGLPEDSSEAWKLTAGWLRPALECQNCLAFTVQADMGYTFAMASNWLLTGYFGGSVSEGNGVYGHYQLRATIEVQGQLTPEINVFIVSRKNYYPDTNLISDERFELGLRYKVSRNWDVRFHIRDQDITEFGTSIGYYW